MRTLMKVIALASRNYSSRFQKNIYNLISQEEYRDFKVALTRLVDEVGNQQHYLNIPKNNENIAKIKEYTIEDGPNESSVILLHASNHLTHPDTMSSKEVQQAYVLAWVLVMLQSHKMILGKIDDEKKPDREISNRPACEANFLRSYICDVLEHYFKDHRNYNKIFHLYNKGLLYAALREMLNDTISKAKHNKYVTFNPELYNVLCEYSTSYDKFILPIFLAMQLNTIEDKSLYDHIRSICFDLAKLYQIKEEYNDCFGKESIVNRSSGSHIQRGECTWFAIKALQRCTPSQRIVFNSCYGSNEPAHVERVKLLYEQLKLPQLYRNEEGALCESVTQRVEIVDGILSVSPIFFTLLDAICKQD